MAKMICPACGSVGTPKTHTKGSLFLELILWLMMLLPGLLYTMWRLTTRQQVCRSCLQPGLVPASSPRGRQLAQQFSQVPGAQSPG